MHMNMPIPVFVPLHEEHALVHEQHVPARIPLRVDEQHGRMTRRHFRSLVSLVSLVSGSSARVRVDGRRETTSMSH
jgi:hypothetical protein